MHYNFRSTIITLLVTHASYLHYHMDWNRVFKTKFQKSMYKVYNNKYIITLLYNFTSGMAKKEPLDGLFYADECPLSLFRSLRQTSGRVRIQAYSSNAKRQSLLPLAIGLPELEEFIWKGTFKLHQSLRIKDTFFAKKKKKYKVFFRWITKYTKLQTTKKD